MVVVEKVSSFHAAAVNTALHITAVTEVPVLKRDAVGLLSNLYTQQGTPTLVGLCIYKRWTLKKAASYLYFPFSAVRLCCIRSKLLPGIGTSTGKPQDLRHLGSQTSKSGQEFQVTEVFENINSGSCGILEMQMQRRYNA